MASLWKRSSSKFWFACFTDHLGKQRKKSTRETDKKKALKLAELLEAEYKRTRTSGQMQKLLLEVHREITGEILKPVSLIDFQTGWLKSKKAEGCADSTVVFYTHATARFIEWLGVDAAKPMGSITRAQVESFRNHLTGSLATKTVNHQLKGVKMLFKAALEQGLLSDNPAAAVKTIAAKRATVKRKEAFTLEQVRTILGHCDSEWKTLVLLGLYSGQRLADLQNLKWNQISKEADMLTLVTRKTGTAMTIPAAASLKAHLQEMPRPKDNEAYVLLGLAKLRTNTLSGVFADKLVEAGIRSKDESGDQRDHSRLSFHSLRHSAVTMLKEAGVPLATVKALIGHSSDAMSENYTKIGVEAMTAGAAAFPEI